jgi:hypothetical protein
MEDDELVVIFVESMQMLTMIDTGITGYGAL